MHELGIAQNILEIVRQSIPGDQAGAVRGIRIRVGQLSGVVADSLEFCFGAMVSDTDMRRATLAIEQVPTTAQCRDCGHRFRVEEFDFACSGCGSARIDLVSGKELEVVEIEMAEEQDEGI